MPNIWIDSPTRGRATAERIPVLAETSPMMGDEALDLIVSPALKHEAIKTAAFDPRPLVHMLARAGTCAARVRSSEHRQHDRHPTNATSIACNTSLRS